MEPIKAFKSQKVYEMFRGILCVIHDINHANLL